MKTTQPTRFANLAKLRSTASTSTSKDLSMHFKLFVLLFQASHITDQASQYQNSRKEIPRS
jgi:hypothetical protein